MHSLRHVALQCLEHGVTPAAVDLPSRVNMLVEKTICGVENGAGHDPFVMDICALFDVEKAFL